MAVESGYNFNFNNRFVLHLTSGEAFSFVKNQYPSASILIGSVKYSRTKEEDRGKAFGGKGQAFTVIETVEVTHPTILLESDALRDSPEMGTWVHIEKRYRIKDIANLPALFDLYGFSGASREAMVAPLKTIETLRTRLLALPRCVELNARSSELWTLKTPQAADNAAEPLPSMLACLRDALAPGLSASWVTYEGI